MLKSTAPAKINLILEVIGKRPDGYHEIRSIIHSINLCDYLYFEKSDNIQFECSLKSLSNHDNLVIRAVKLLKSFTEYEGGVKIRLEKNIPVSAGMGGGSSDAASTLLSLNKLWRTNLKIEILIELAKQLGSDVPYFLYKNTALVEGRGEIVKPTSSLKKQWFVVLIPEVPMIPDKTKTLYSKLNSCHYTSGLYVNNFLKEMTIKQIDEISLYNVFDSVALNSFPNIKVFWEIFKKTSKRYIHFIGSGPSMYCPIDNLSSAKNLIQNLQQYIKCKFLYVTSFVSKEII